MKLVFPTELHELTVNDFLMSFKMIKPTLLDSMVLTITVPGYHICAVDYPASIYRNIW